MSLAQNLRAVRARLGSAAVAAGRDPESVGLIAVSKTKPLSMVAEAVQAGQRHFGENYAQELRDKSRDGAALDVCWHFIGRVQTNKAKYIAPVAHRVHALETVHQAEALARRAPGPLECLLAVHIGGEASKGGVHPSEALQRCRELATVGGIVVVGLMALPPWRDDPEDSAPFFDELATLAARGRADGLPLHELSMGMSHDFEVAIRYGATWVRVGTAIFGARSTT